MTEAKNNGKTMFRYALRFALAATADGSMQYPFCFVIPAEEESSDCLKTSDSGSSPE
jgi:hypothetical protein